MQKDEMIAAAEFCRHYNIDLAFIYSLQDSGLVKTEMVDNNVYVPVTQLSHLERLVKWHYEMDINVAGLEAITHLLARLNSMHHQIVQLSNRLGRYEGD